MGARATRLRCLGLGALALLCWTLPGTLAAAEGFRVIANPSVPASRVERRFLDDAFLKRVTRWGDGQTIHPVDLQATSPVREAFTRSVLQRSVAAVRSYWQQLIFAGRTLPPPELDSDAAVVAYVASTPGAIGYVSAATPAPGAKEVLVE